jgi:SAM-dependent methyltransferase
MQRAAAGEYYDLIAKYWDKMYAREPFYKKGFQFIDSLRRKNHLGNEILDVACGTGYLLTFFEKAGYKTYGSDLSAGMLKIARNALAHTKLKQAAFQNVSFGRKFPLIVSFFNSFAYCLSKAELEKTLENLVDQLSDNGLLVFDLFVTGTPKDTFGIKSYSFDNTHISRTFYGYARDRKWHSEMMYIIIEDRKSKLVTEKTTRGIFSEKDVISCINQAGLKPIYIGPGYMGNVAKTFVVQKEQ